MILCHDLPCCLNNSEVILRWPDHRIAPFCICSSVQLLVLWAKSRLAQWCDSFLIFRIFCLWRLCGMNHNWVFSSIRPEDQQKFEDQKIPGCPELQGTHTDP